jgi:assimilatory nitrate reductase electron transfer subunit
MTRVVVVGNGMAGSRVADELLRRDPSLLVTVLGAESRPAYNRVLLSDVLARRRRPEQIELAVADGAVRRPGTEVVAIDRGARTVTAADGSSYAYDALVLATGSTALVPPVHGIAGPSGRLLRGVHVFRTVEDCDAIAAEAGRARRAVVVGGGVLGLEAARGLMQHGLDVEVVHGASHLMDAQLDPLGGAVLRRAVESLGVGVHLGSFAASVTGGRRVTGVGLADGRYVEGDLVVLACGVRPQVQLARDSGLDVRRGVVVDDRLQTSDPSVFALGECAEHDGQVYGLVAPAWEQAAALAEVLTGGTARYRGSRTITRLKALGLDLVSMGETAPGVEDCEGGLEVLQWADPVRHVYKKVVVRDGVVVGAVLLGDTCTSGVVTQAYDRGTTLPDDRTHLLFHGLGVAPSGPEAYADDDVVCTCNGVSAGALRQCAASGCRTIEEVAAATCATTGCGTCTSAVRSLLASSARRAELAGVGT